MSDEELLNRVEDLGAEVDRTLERMMGDEELYVKHLRKLPENQCVAELKAAIEAGDGDKANALMHTLKGNALNLGLLPPVDACEDMLVDLRAGENEKAFAQFDIVAGCFGKFVDAVCGK